MPKLTIHGGLQYIMFPVGSKQSKKYIFGVNDKKQNYIKDRKTNETIISFDSFEYYELYNICVFFLTCGESTRLATFDNKGKIHLSKPFKKCIDKLNDYIIVKDLDDERKIINVNYMALEMKNGNEMFPHISNFIVLPTVNNSKVILDIKTLNTYSKEFTEYNISANLGIAIIKPVYMDQWMVVKLKDFEDSIATYDNIKYYCYVGKFAKEQVSKDYLIVKDNNEYGIMKISDLDVTFIKDCKNIIPINNEYCFIDNGEEKNIMRLSDGVIAKW